MPGRRPRMARRARGRRTRRRSRRHRARRPVRPRALRRATQAHRGTAHPSQDFTAMVPERSTRSRRLRGGLRGAERTGRGRWRGRG